MPACEMQYSRTYDTSARAWHWGRLGTEAVALVQRAGTPMGPNDLWIATHALAEERVVVTGNVREFSRVPGLQVEDHDAPSSAPRRPHRILVRPEENA